MFNNQFGMAHSVTTAKNPVFIYATETAIQLAIVELNENLREIYVEAYTQPSLAEYIYQKTSTKLSVLFAAYNPGWEESDFYESEIGSAGMMRAYMLRKCDKYFTLRKKIERFLNMSLKSYSVPDDVIAQTIAALSTVDIENTAKKVMNDLFAALEVAFGFKFENQYTFCKE